MEQTKASHPTQATKTVVVGLSGGVDSSVAAYLLVQQGYDVRGIYMRNWVDSAELHGNCPFEEDSQFAEMVARRLGIPFEVVDLSAEYRRRVVSYLFEEYERGRTPNPDVLCNREIKFDAFWEVARARGADLVATGHYCRRGVRVVNGIEQACLLAGVDRTKDQSYFLCQVSREQLEHACFPLGGMTKAEVRRLAADLHLATAQRRDSYGICFVGEVDMMAFLSQRLQPRTGDIIEIPRDYQPQPPGPSLREQAKPYVLDRSMGQVVGQHHGAQFFTIGQRKGLGVGGKALPLFVLGLDVIQNLVYVGQGHDHPLLNRRVVRVSGPSEHWIDEGERIANGDGRHVLSRLRYRQPLQTATLRREEGELFLVFDTPQRGVTPGQFAAWYEDERLVGSAPVAE